MVIGWMRGWRIFYDDEAGIWRWLDNGMPCDSEKRPCAKCNRGDGTVDECMGWVPGATSVCCGHGKEEAYIMMKDGTTIRGQASSVRKFARMLQEKDGRNDNNNDNS